jgi:bacillithiol system protein YtxJ
MFAKTGIDIRMDHEHEERDQSGPFSAVDGPSELDAWFDRSHQETVVLFLHDPWCPISGRANSEMRSVEYAPIAVVDVARQRDVSREVQRQTGIRHESPQVIILREGKAVWDASHFAITGDAVSRAIGAVQVDATESGDGSVQSADRHGATVADT